MIKCGQWKHLAFMQPHEVFLGRSDAQKIYSKKKLKEGDKMKLLINREQISHAYGPEFLLKVKVILTDEEVKLINRYCVHKEVLLKKEVWSGYTIGNLVKGQSFKEAKIAQIIAIEEAVKEGCKTFKAYIEIMKQFGGTEMIEYEVINGEIVERRIE